MNPSHVRLRILQEHETLRQRLNELEDAVNAILIDSTSSARVVELTRKLLLELERHTELEDEILAPALMEVDAWGPVRADQLLQHHRLQRAEVRELTRLFEMHVQPRDVARVANSLTRDLRADMEYEERDILSADLLRDDVVAVASNSG
jgi:hypothetical protein